MRKIASMMIAVSLMAGSSIAALVMDLDADTLGLADGASVATWADQTANGNDAVQTNVTAQPTFVASNAAYNNHATVSFDGSHFMDLNGSMITVDSFTLFLVGHVDITGVEQYFISGQGGGGDDRIRLAGYPWNTDRVQVRVGNIAGYDMGVGTLNTNAHVMAITGTSDAWFDLGSKITGQANTAGALSPSGFVLGCYDDAVNGVLKAFLTGDIAEVRLYDEILDAAAVETINAELFATYNAVIPIEVTSTYPDPDAYLTTNDFPLVLGGVLVDGTSAVDTNSIQLILDSNTLTLASGDVVKTATTTTVSHAVSALDLGTHTLSLVYDEGAASITNTWTFMVHGDPGNMVYVDATTNNTAQWDGAGFSTFTPDGTGSNWTTRGGFGNEGETFQSQFTSNSPMLKTSVSVASGTYKVYAYMWAAGNTQNWRMEASTNTTSLPLYLTTDYPDIHTNLYVHYQDAEGADLWGNFTGVALYESTDLISNPFGTQAVRLANGDRRLVEIYLGTVTGTEISVYVDDDANGVTSEERTWYDGIGYELIAGGGPTIDPDIQSIVVSGGNASLIWNSEIGATYSILHKTNLTDAVWTPVKTGITGGDPTTSDAVPVSGAGQEFFSIEGE